jgi:hypothetical protein
MEMKVKTHQIALIMTTLLATTTQTQAGILNYHRNFALACAEPAYLPALDVRTNSVALADAIRDMSTSVLDLTRGEEHWSLSMLQGLTAEANAQKYNMLLSANKALASSTEAVRRINSVSSAQKKIMSDAMANQIPGKGMEVFGAMKKTAANASGESFEASVNKQLEEYHEKLITTQKSIEETTRTISEIYESETPILSPQHIKLSNQIRQSTKLTISLLTMAEEISEKTVIEVRDTAAAMQITSCGNEK